MANETVTETPLCGRYCLPLKDVDRGGFLCDRVDAIADLMGTALNDPQTLAGNTPLAACEAMRELVAELKGIIERREAEIKAA